MKAISHIFAYSPPNRKRIVTASDCKLSNPRVASGQNMSEACPAKRVPKRTCGVAWRREVARSKKARSIDMLKNSARNDGSVTVPLIVLMPGVRLSCRQLEARRSHSGHLLEPPEMGGNTRKIWTGSYAK